LDSAGEHDSGWFSYGQPSREKYLGRVEAMRKSGPRRGALGCANLAHGFAACAAHEKQDLRTGTAPSGKGAWTTSNGTRRSNRSIS
jgi:hypothetical protein